MDFLKMLAAYIVISYSCFIVTETDESKNLVTLERIEKMLKSEFGKSAPDLGMVLARLCSITKGLEQEYKSKTILKNQTRLFNKTSKSKDKSEFIFVCPQCKHKYRIYLNDV